MHGFFKQTSKYLSLVKFSHTIFSIPFAVIGFFLGVKAIGESPDWFLFLLVLFCVLFARNAAMGFNRYADRHIDKKNPRTSNREIPGKVIKPYSALIFVIINAAFFIITTLFINTLCFFLSPVALLVILGYSYTKRFTYLAHFVLGIGLALAPIGAYLAVTAQFHWVPLFYSFAVLFWVGGFDIIYALQDEAIDREQKLKSIPAFLGRKMALYLSIVIHFVCATFIVLAAIVSSNGIFHWIGTGIFICLLIYQHLIIRPSDIKRINLAFFTTNGVASLILGIFTILDIFVKIEF